MVHLRGGLAGRCHAVRTYVILRRDGNPAQPHSVLRLKPAEALGGLLSLRNGSDLLRLLVAFHGRDNVLLPDGPHPLSPSVLPGCLQGECGEAGQGGEDDHLGGGGFLYKLPAVSPHQDHVPGDTHPAQCALRDQEHVLNHLQEHQAVRQHEQLSGPNSVLLHAATVP